MKVSDGKVGMHAKLSPGCGRSTVVDEISPRRLRLSPVRATRDCKVVAMLMLGASELRFDSGEPKCGTGGSEKRWWWVSACVTRVPQC